MMIRFCAIILAIFMAWICASPANASSPEELYQNAMALDREEFYADAAEAWEKLLSSNPGKNLTIIGRLKLSSAYLKIGQPFKAVESVKALLEQAPENFDIYFHYANALAKIKKYPEAIKAYQKAIRIRPDEGLGYIGLALCYFGNGNPDAAIEELQKAKKIFKDKNNISWYRDARIMVHQIKSFEKYPPNFADLWLENNLDVVRKTYEKTIFNVEALRN